MRKLNKIFNETIKTETINESVTHEVFRKEGFVVDITAYKVIINGVQVNMSLKKYKLLFYLIRNKNMSISRDKLINEVWGYDYYGNTRTLDTHIKLLRKSMGPYAGMITTIHGFGYKFED